MIAAEPLPEAFARHRESLDGAAGLHVIIIFPDGSGMRAWPVGSGLEAERLNRDEAIAALTELYGLSAFREQ